MYIIYTGTNKKTNLAFDGIQLIHLASNIYKKFTLYTMPRKNKQIVNLASKCWFFWVPLPADILTCDSESAFKRLLKTHLFNNCFNVAWLTHSQRLCSSAYGALQICFMIMIIIDHANIFSSWEQVQCPGYARRALCCHEQTTLPVCWRFLCY